MGTHWISIGKLVGSVVGEVETYVSKLCSHVSPEPALATGKCLRTDDGIIVERLESLTRVLEDNAMRPPIVAYYKFVDAWTMVPTEFISNMLQGIGSRKYVISAGNVQILLVVVEDMLECIGELRRLADRMRGDPERIDETRQIAILLSLCAETWSGLLDGVDTAIFVWSMQCGPSWMDEEVTRAAESVPPWLADLKNN